MKEQIAFFADHAGSIAMAVAFVFFAIEAVADERALAAAFFAPIAVFFTILAVLRLSFEMNWI